MPIVLFDYGKVDLTRFLFNVLRVYINKITFLHPIIS